MNAGPEGEALTKAGLNGLSCSSASAVKDVFGRKRVDEFTDGWLGPEEFGPVLAMLEAAPGGATLSGGHVSGILLHQHCRHPEPPEIPKTANCHQTEQRLPCRL